MVWTVVILAAAALGCMVRTEHLLAHNAHLFFVVLRAYVFFFAPFFADFAFKEMLFSMFLAEVFFAFSAFNEEFLIAVVAESFFTVLMAAAGKLINAVVADNTLALGVVA